jgi:uncharacterized SAM-binding protein YcdF (DUF218 family)
MKRFISILRIIAFALVVYFLLDYFLKWHTFRKNILLIILFFIIYFLTSIINMFLAAKRRGCNCTNKQTPPADEKPLKNN